VTSGVAVLVSDDEIDMVAVVLGRAIRTTTPEPPLDTDAEADPTADPPTLRASVAPETQIVSLRRRRLNRVAAPGRLSIAKL
jgi:hypothetical protein